MHHHCLGGWPLEQFKGLHLGGGSTPDLAQRREEATVRYTHSVRLAQAVYT